MTVRRRLAVVAALATAAAAAALVLAPRCGGAPPAHAPRPDGAVEARVVAAYGTVERQTQGRWVRARVGDTLRADDAIRTRLGAHADVEVDADSRMTVTESTELSVRDLTETLHRYRLARGRVSVEYGPNAGRVVRIESADANAVVEAPEARFAVLGTGLTFAVATETGTVDLSARGRTTRVPPGHQAVVVAGEAPRAPVPLPTELLLRIAQQSRVDAQKCERFDGAVEVGVEVVAGGAPVETARDGRFTVRTDAGAPVELALRDVSGHARRRVLRCREARPTDVSLRWVDAPE